VTIQARFDGKEYPVKGSSFVDSIAYTRADNTITGTGWKGGVVSLRETIAANPKGDTLTATFSLYGGGRQVGSGVAVFRNQRSIES
jgi:hypothetical protein